MQSFLYFSSFFPAYPPEEEKGYVNFNIDMFLVFVSGKKDW